MIMAASAGYSALILGCTGETGKQLIKEISKGDYFKSVKLITRRPIDTSDLTGKFEQVQIDFDDLPSHKDSFSNVDVAFCCLGTTKGKSGRDGFKRVDYDYVVNTATVLKELGCRQFHLVSGQGASSKSYFFYPQVKGMAEEACKAVCFQHMSVYRPGLIMCQRQESRPVERMFRIMMTPFSKIAPAVMTMPVETLAKAMLENTDPEKQITETFENRQIYSLGTKK